MGVSSPCIQICHIDVEAGYCAGCRRTLDEICDWAALTDDERRAVLDLVAERTLAESSVSAANRTE